MIKMMIRAMTKNLINKNIIGILLLANLLISSHTIAEEQTSVSFGILSKNLTTDLRLTIAKENQAASIVDQHIGKATGKTRTEMLQTTIKPLKVSKTRSYNYINNVNFAEFSIYGATTLLQDDYDSDGFYQTFSVIFDADIYSYTERQWGEVYALLYISKNGGPWKHYYTTDNFIIDGESDLDEYEIMTTFLSGYPTDHYDILIDLYQVGNSDIVTSYSSDDSNALYALSLESADYDEVVEISHGGSFSIVIILLFILTYSVRAINRKH